MYRCIWDVELVESRFCRVQGFQNEDNEGTQTCRCMDFRNDLAPVSHEWHSSRR